MSIHSTDSACLKVARDHLTRLLASPALPAWFNSVEEADKATGEMARALRFALDGPVSDLAAQFSAWGEFLQKRYAPSVSLLINETREMQDDLTRLSQLHLVERKEDDLTTRLTEARRGLMAGALKVQARVAGELFRPTDTIDWEMDVTRHRHWYQAILKSLCEDEARLPDTSLAHCPFSDWLNSLEFQLLTQHLDHSDKSGLLILHHALHDQAIHLEHALAQGQLADALLGLSEFQKLYALLENRLKDAYVAFQSDRIGQFFRFFSDVMTQDDKLSYFMTVVIEIQKSPASPSMLRQALLNIYRAIKKTPLTQNRVAGVVENGSSLHILYRYAHKEDIKRVLAQLRKAAHSAHDDLNDLFAPRFNIRALETRQLSGMDHDALRMLAGELMRAHPGMPVKLFSEDETRNLRCEVEEGGRILNTVRAAIESHDIQLHFQPVMAVSAERRSLKYCEALARIRHDGQLVEAERFIHAVHEQGLGPLLDAAVLHSLHQQADDIAQHLSAVSCNLFPDSMDQPAVMAALECCLQTFAQRGLNLILEITEYELFHRFDMLNTLYQAYPNLSVALDDFGSGYSSLAAVTALRNAGLVDTLKLDGSLSEQLVENPLDRQVVFLTLDLARHLDLDVVVEHIHSQDIETLLLDHETSFLGQGHLYGAAMPLERIAALIQ
ncbi:EAL domain-containing protein [Hahella sp. SMD15-11]|uniref:EAL domain-containing protein n=1 Tax=Thermohahella caldifontis TaxID=3142973 RepID=A0AB39UXD1_9GAMM